VIKAANFSELINKLKERGVKFDPGLSPEEIALVERAIGAPLPPDLVAFYGEALPVLGIPGEGGFTTFPKWREDPEGAAQKGRVRWTGLFGQ